MTLKPDIPIHNIDSDKLRRYDFAQTIAKTLLNVSQNNNTESFVFGLCGKWGSGKTSLINLIKLSLQQSIESKTNSLKWTSFADFCNKVFNFISKILLVYILCTFSFTEFVLSTNFGYNIINSFSSIFINILDIISVIEWLAKITFILYITIMEPFNLNFLLTLIKNIINNINRSILIRNNSESQKQEPIIVNFSPWNATSKEILLKDFFETLRNKIDETNNNPMYSSVIAAIDNYSKNLCYSFFRGIFQNSSNSDIASLKTNLEEHLLKLNRKIIIFIDDIDRLSTDEIFVLFKLIKSVANFPKIIYFLSFDKEVVINALDNYSHGKGEEFLEKIIQVPINLPQIYINDYQEYLIQGFNDFISLHPQIEKDWNEKYQDYWNLTAHNGFLKLFNSPRDVIRYFNTLEIAYNPKIHGEVNIIDFMIIIALQLFHPQIYEFISTNQELFLVSSNQYNNEDKNEIKSKLNKILESYSPSLRKDFEQLIANLFPYSQIYKTFNLSCETTETRKKNGRICCQEHFHKFFTYNIDENVISLNQMKDVLNSIEDITNFSNKLLDLNTQGKIKNFLEQLENYIDDISCNNVENIIKALFNLGDYFDLSDEGFWAFEIYVNIDRITYQLLQKKELDNQLELLKTCITNNQSIYPAINYINLIKSALTKNKGEIELNYINFDEYQDLAQCLTSELYKWAENDLNSNNDENKPFNGCLIKHRKALSLLYFWYDIGDKQRLKAYLNVLTKENTGFIEFLHILKHKIRSSSGVHYNEYYKIQKEELLTFLGDIDIHERLDQIDKTLLPSNDKEVIELTLKALNNNNNDF